MRGELLSSATICERDCLNESAGVGSSSSEPVVFHVSAFRRAARLAKATRLSGQMAP